jgi:hypothetical protein
LEFFESCELSALALFERQEIRLWAELDVLKIGYKWRVKAIYLLFSHPNISSSLGSSRIESWLIGIAGAVFDLRHSCWPVQLTGSLNFDYLPLANSVFVHDRCSLLRTRHFKLCHTPIWCVTSSNSYIWVSWGFLVFARWKRRMNTL